eukprot:scaffold2724_cov260-Pinguiococcus_pyrenoidosus.AAC.11
MAALLGLGFAGAGNDEKGITPGLEYADAERLLERRQRDGKQPLGEEQPWMGSGSIEPRGREAERELVPPPARSRGARPDAAPVTIALGARIRQLEKHRDALADLSITTRTGAAASWDVFTEVSFAPTPPTGGKASARATLGCLSPEVASRRWIASLPERVALFAMTSLRP